MITFVYNMVILARGGWSVWSGRGVGGGRRGGEGRGGGGTHQSRVHRTDGRHQRY